MAVIKFLKEKNLYFLKMTMIHLYLNRITAKQGLLRTSNHTPWYTSSCPLGESIVVNDNISHAVGAQTSQFMKCCPIYSFSQQFEGWVFAITPLIWQIRNCGPSEAAPELGLFPVSLSCTGLSFWVLSYLCGILWYPNYTWIARKFCSCFGILLWQRVLSEDPHELEDKTQQQTQH